MNQLKPAYFSIFSLLLILTTNLVSQIPPHKDPFVYSWNHLKNTKFELKDSDFMVLQRIGNAEILQFLKWWEKKYSMTEFEIENVYTMHSAKKGRELKYWQSLSKLGQDQMRLAWFRENGSEILPEYQLFVLARVAQIHSFKDQEHSDHCDENANSESKFKSHKFSFRRARQKAHRQRAMSQ